jgi:ATP-dependent Lon protease
MNQREKMMKMNIQLADGPFFDTEFPIMSDQEEKSMFGEDIPEELGILPLKNTVLYPGVVIPITVGRDKSIALVKAANEQANKIIGVVAQRNMHIEDPEYKDLYRYGTVARILKLIRMPDGSITIVIQGRSRFEVTEFLSSEPYFRATVSKLDEYFPGKRESEALTQTLQRQAAEIIELSPNIPTEAQVVLNNISSLSFLVYFIASNLHVEVKDKQVILEMDDMLEKGRAVLEQMSRELAILELSEEIHSKVRTDLDKQQREYFLRQQIKTIQDELGDDGPGNEIDELRKRANEKIWPDAVQEIFEKEITKLSRLSPNMPDYAVVVPVTSSDCSSCPGKNYSRRKL